jgi:hypothetical protein
MTTFREGVETMAAMNENERTEYSVLMSRGRDAERTTPILRALGGQRSGGFAVDGSRRTNA